uniref:Beta-defensin n=2 Tax=Sus scrofa TaxID=9823 RepID=A0A4X1V767_PIG
SPASFFVFVCLFAARSYFLYKGCPGGRRNCKMKCDNDEYAIKYCEDWTICCKLKQTEFKERRRVSAIAQREGT